MLLAATSTNKTRKSKKQQEWELTKPCIGGDLTLDFVNQFSMFPARNKFVVGFHVSGNKQGWLVFVDPTQLMHFNRFAKRLLEACNIWVRHPAESPRKRKEWVDDVSKAIEAGREIDANLVPGYKLIGGHQ